MLAPLVRSGYVLRYDMVFVPRQPLRADLLAPGGTLPRAVPLDALVGLSALAVPGWLVQRAVLAAILAAAVLGAYRLVPARRTGTRLVAAVAYAWTPFLAERLLLGHWGLLLCYAALPWLVAAARDGSLPRLVLAAACASATPTGGVIAMAVTVALTGPRRWLPVAALNAPWLVAALLTTAPGRSDPAAVEAFAARAENWGGSFVALLGTGGIWNAHAVPGSRTGWPVPVFTIGLLVAAAFGFAVLRRRWPEGTANRLALLAAVSLLLAAAGTVPPTTAALRFAVEHVPGAGLLRDGQKLLIPYALCLALCLALAAERIAGRVPAGRLVLAGFTLLPVAMLPDLAWGAGGKLRPVSYPAEWTAVARTVAADPGPVLSLPMSAYRAYDWNPGTVVIDPATRYLPAPVITDDRLRVGNSVIDGESPAAAEIRTRLAAGSSPADPSIHWVLVQDGSAPAGPNLVPDGSAPAGLTLVHRGPTLTLYRNPGYLPSPSRAPAAVLVAYLLAATVAAAALIRRSIPS
ncbi:hypothetical protein [Paractinoplanes rishiriensis]|uniref:Uncharacterized protein n=1 Tax=Paractinoplanes rishiriensis TaxID=1050105 RepID=A0A919JW55_9ACTN|nr:hypothetical protein [Actinoplanes rishiriensis]GIE94369.1 hypothetical protein Ari01nite_18340 [Actinoplanes rishiriensis]